MNYIGEIKTGKELGLVSRNKHIWHSCITCGKERWVRLLHGKPMRLHCEDCNGDVSHFGDGNIKHGYRNTRLYGIWRGMKNRCLLKTTEAYRYYGARGITVCPMWMDFIPFKDWAITHGYKDTLSIDRIDNDGNYEPNNCRWIPLEENNSRRWGKTIHPKCCS